MKTHFNRCSYVGARKIISERAAKPLRSKIAEREAQELAEIAMTDTEWITQHRKATA